MILHGTGTAQHIWGRLSRLCFAIVLAECSSYKSKSETGFDFSETVRNSTGGSCKTSGIRWWSQMVEAIQQSR